MKKQLDQHKRILNLILFFVSLILAYIFASRSLDSANLWEYAATFTLLIFGISRIVQAIKKSE